MKNHAILFPGHLRCMDDNLLAFLDSCNASCKIFIVTERSFSAEAEVLNARYDADVFYIEDATSEDLGLPNSDFFIAHQDKRILHPEFIKLECALRRLVGWEKTNKFEFLYIHKFRTDIPYPIGFHDYIKPVTDAQRNPSMLFLNWSINFSGSREAMLMLIGYPMFCMQYVNYADFFNNVITRVNVQALRDSPYTGAFLSFPVAILNSNDAVADFHDNIKIEYPSYVDAIESFAKRIRLEGVPDVLRKSLLSGSSDNVNIVRTYLGQWFPYFPEHIFFVYINYLNLSTGSYSILNPSFETPLKFARHATTRFTATIFGQIQAKDYSFLSMDYPWEMEIASFKASGGLADNALQKLVQINPAELSVSDCKAFYRIIDIFNEPGYLVCYRKTFIDSILARGVEPPLCLKAHLENL